MKLSDTTYDNAQTGCCARLDPALWDGRRLEWKDKPFLRDHIRAFLHIPLNFGSVISRDHAAIEAAEAYAQEPICLSEEVSLWGSDVFVAIDRDVPNATIEKISGTFLTRIFQGPYRMVGKWAVEMEEYVRAQGHTLRRTLFYYATCPTCAKHYGANQVVIFAQIQ